MPFAFTYYDDHTIGNSNTAFLSREARIDSLERISIDCIQREGVQVTKSPVTVVAGNRLGKLFDNFINRMEDDDRFRQTFSDIAGKWEQNLHNRKHYGGFFKNYYRNREGVAGFDEKVVWQASSDFLANLSATIARSGEHDTNLSEFVISAANLLEIGKWMLTPAIIELCAKGFFQNSRILLPSHREYPCTIRFMRYRPDEYMSTNPHVDKTVVSTIVWNSDPPDQQKLAFAPQSFESAKLSDYHPITWAGPQLYCPAYTFFGAAMEQLGMTEFRAKPHAVLPANGRAYRYSIAIFWLLPELDLSSFSTAVEYEDDANLVRPAN